MQTYSHLLMTAAARKAMPSLEIPRSAALLGSVAPDLPLYVMTATTLWFYPNVHGWTVRQAARHIFDHLYFQDPLWIAFHSFLHSPLNLGLLFAANYCFRNRWPRLARWFFWFLSACLLHSLVDVVTHFDDGPVLFWPLNWSYRFASPISYWDPNHYGSEFARFEHVLDLVLLGYLLLSFLPIGNKKHQN